MDRSDAGWTRSQEQGARNLRVDAEATSDRRDRLRSSAGAADEHEGGDGGVR